MSLPPASRTWAGALLSGGQFETRRSISGEARGPLCGMGTCFECRVSTGEASDVRTCREPEASRVAQPPAPSQRLPQRELQADVLVIGGGPAGLAAAASAAQTSKKVILLDDNLDLGGQIWRAAGASASAAASSVQGQTEPATLGRTSGYRRWLAACLANGVHIERGASVVAAPSPQEVLVDARQGAFRVRTQQLIVCTGARELFLPFPGWTLPGVMGVGGLQALVKGGFDVRGRKIVIAGSGPLLLAVAAHVRACGADVLELVEQADFANLRRLGLRLWQQPAKLAQLATFEFRLRGVKRSYASWVTRAEGAGQLAEVLLERAGRVERIACDVLATGFGLLPEVSLAAHLGCRIDGGALAVDAEQRTNVAGVFGAGECTGVGGAELATFAGRIAGYCAAGAPERARPLFALRARQQRFAAELAAAFQLRPELRGLVQDDTLVCRCEDVSFAALRQQPSARHAKLQTRAGMGACQGRVCGPALEFLLGWPNPQQAPPFFPTSLETLASFASAPSALT